MHVERVTTDRGLEEFLELSQQRSEMLRPRLDVQREPFWWSATRELWLLRDGRRVVGRVGAVHNRAYDAHHGDGAGFFAWLHAPDDLGAVRALLEAASNHLRREGRRLIRGPLHLGLGEDLGMMVDGFDEPRWSLAPWNPVYLPRHLETLGFRSVHERHGYHWSRDEVPPPPDSLRQVTSRDKVAGATTVIYRSLDPTRPHEEVRRFVQTFNAAYAGRYGFVPLTEAEARARIREIQAYADLKLVWLAEVGGEPAGIVVGVPLLSEDETAPSVSLRRMISTLRSALSQKRVTYVHLVAIAVDPRFAALHIGAQLMLRVWRAALDLGVREAELSGVDADDKQMQQMLWRLGCRRSRRFAVYEQKL